MNNIDYFHQYQQLFPQGYVQLKGKICVNSKNQSKGLLFEFMECSFSEKESENLAQLRLTYEPAANITVTEWGIGK